MYGKLMTSIALLMMLGFQIVAHAQECGVIKFMQDKSRGAALISNDCEQHSAMGIGSTVALAPNGRLWLYINAGSDNNFQMICQNRHATAVNVIVNSLTSPWLEPQGLTNCAMISKSKLVCDSERKKNVFFCAIAAIKPTTISANTIERTSSVKMRSIFTMTEQTEKTNKPELDLEEIKADINLCRNLYQNDSALDVSWMLNKSGQINNLSIDVNGVESAQDKDLGDCVAAAVFSSPIINVEQDTVYNIHF